MRRIASALPLLFTACAGMQVCPQRHAIVRQPAMSCAELNTTTAAAVKRLGYTIESFDPAATGEIGKVQAIKRDYDDSSYTMTVELRCSSEEAIADAVATVGCAGQISFPNEFSQSFQKSMAKKVDRVSIIPEEERTGLLVEVEPLRDDKPVGVSLGAANLMLVKVTIDNRTARVYRLEGDGIVLISQNGSEVSPVPPADAARRVGAAKGADAAQALGQHALRPGTIEAEGKLEGYLYVPRQAYKRATVRLVDQEAEEPEGFTIEF